MQQPPEDRLAALEASAQRNEQTAARLAAIAENNDRLRERILATREGILATRERIANLLEEVTREAATTRRLWLRLAQRYGWLDDEENGAQPDTLI